MKLKLCIIALLLARSALAGEPVTWIVSYADNVAKDDKTNLLASVRSWTDVKALPEASLVSHKRARGKDVRWFGFWHAEQFNVKSLLEKATIDGLKFSSTSVVTIVKSLNPVVDLEKAGWTNITESTIEVPK